jgi:hypothetical protein
MATEYEMQESRMRDIGAMTMTSRDLFRSSWSVQAGAMMHLQHYSSTHSCPMDTTGCIDLLRDDWISVRHY